MNFSRTQVVWEPGSDGSASGGDRVTGVLDDVLLREDPVPSPEATDLIHHPEAKELGRLLLAHKRHDIQLLHQLLALDHHLPMPHRTVVTQLVEVRGEVVLGIVLIHTG